MGNEYHHAHPHPPLEGEGFKAAFAQRLEREIP
jgi:hypothetical protein